MPAGHRLHDHQRVVPEGGVERVAQLAVAVDLRDPNRRAEPRRLDEQRQAQALELARVLAVAQRHVLHLRQPGLGHQALERDLVHAERRGKARPRPRRARRRVSSSPWTVPSSPNGPVERREDHVGPEQPVAGFDRHRLAAARPAPLAGDLDRHRLVPGWLEPLEHRGRRGQRDLVLARPPPGQYCDPHSAGAGSASGVAGCLELPDRDHHRLALRHLACRAPGCWRTTMPSCDWSLTVFSLDAARWKPAVAELRWRAWPVVKPTHVGHDRLRRALSTPVIVTRDALVRPGAAAAGLCEMTLPFGRCPRSPRRPM